VSPGIFWETRGRKTSAVGSRYQTTASDDSYRCKTLVCVTVNCKVQSRTVSKGPINSIINQNPVYGHSIHMTIVFLSLNEKLSAFMVAIDSFNFSTSQKKYFVLGTIPSSELQVINPRSCLS
jgi:hypothetical protein